MIKQSFIFLPGIGKRKEQQLWAQNITDWADFIHARKIWGISAERKKSYDLLLREAQKSIQENNASFFLRELHSKEMWRLYPQFREESCFLDIEVDSSGRAIVVGVSDYYAAKWFVAGANLERCLLEQELRQFKLIITFNGSSFDLPKLQRQFGIVISVPHIDLKPLCVGLGLRGGLKEIEKQLELKRPPHLHGNPVELWKAFHASGDREYLDLLLEYNREDVENLRAVMEHVYKKVSEKVYKSI